MNMWAPVISTIGRTVTPGASMGQTKYEMPRVWARPDRSTMRIPKRASWASEVQVFWPVTTHSSPSRTAQVVSDARSEPAPGSLKSWHQISSPDSSRGR